MIVHEIEKSILYVVHHMDFTTHQLAVCNVFYNASTGLTLEDLAERLGPGSRRRVSGILSGLAHVIDNLERPSARYGFSGYLLFFERFNGDLHRIRPELKAVIEGHPRLLRAMQMPIAQLYEEFEDGLEIH